MHQGNSTSDRISSSRAFHAWSHGVGQRKHIALNKMLGASRKLPPSSCACTCVFLAPGWSVLHVQYSVKNRPESHSVTASQIKSVHSSPKLWKRPMTAPSANHTHWNLQQCDTLFRLEPQPWGEPLRPQVAPSLGEKGWQLAHASWHKKYVHREIHAIKGLALPATPLAQWQLCAGMDRRFALKFDTNDGDLSAAPALRSAVLEGLPKRSRQVRLQHAKPRLRPQDGKTNTKLSQSRRGRLSSSALSSLSSDDPAPYSLTQT